LAAAEDLAELFAEFEVEDDARDRHHRRAVQGPAQRLREVLVVRRVRGAGVDGAADVLVVEGPEQDPDLVVDVNPG
jgi:hypothetical protein